MHILNNAFPVFPIQLEWSGVDYWVFGEGRGVSFADLIGTKSFSPHISGGAVVAA